MTGIVVMYTHLHGEYNVEWHKVLEAKSESVVDIARAIKEYGIEDWALVDGCVYIIKERIEPELIIPILKTLKRE